MFDDSGGVSVLDAGMLEARKDGSAVCVDADEGKQSSPLILLSFCLRRFLGHRSAVSLGFAVKCVPLDRFVMCEMCFSIAGVAEVQTGAGRGKELGATDVAVNGVVAGERGEGVSLDKSGEGADPFLKEREEVNASQNDMLEKKGRLEASDDSLRSAMAEVVRLSGELNGNVDLLNECQVSVLSLR